MTPNWARIGKRASNKLLRHTIWVPAFAGMSGKLGHAAFLRRPPITSARLTEAR
jgi:hypothetical protein